MAACYDLRLPMIYALLDQQLNLKFCKPHGEEVGRYGQIPPSWQVFLAGYLVYN